VGDRVAKEALFDAFAEVAARWQAGGGRRSSTYLRRASDRSRISRRRSARVSRIRLITCARLRVRDC